MSPSPALRMIPCPHIGFGWLWLGQARAKWEARPGLDGTASVGAWHHTGDINALDGTSQASASGPFVTAEQTVGPFYLARLRPWLALQPDLQWLVQRAPGVSSAVSPVLTCHVEVEF